MKVSLNEAREKRLTRYFTGVPCKHGHIAERIVSTRTCVDCKREKDAAREARSYTDEQKIRHYEVIKAARKRDPERYNKISANWKANNKDSVRSARRKRQSERLKSDPVFALRHRASCLVRQAIKSRDFAKSSTTFKIIGCTNNELREHLERQFLKGMSWDNFGDWHIDHIVPISSAKNEYEVISMNHFTNLRPMWARENLIKSNKMEYLI